MWYADFAKALTLQKLVLDRTDHLCYDLNRLYPPKQPIKPSNALLCDKCDETWNDRNPLADRWRQSLP
jgi:hypothetical protein